MKAISIGQTSQVIQRGILIDISELAQAIEEEFGEIFHAFEPGWYHQLDEEHPTMPDMVKGVPQIYHTKGGEVVAPWGEQVTIVTDPNNAKSSVYNQDNEMVLSIYDQESARKNFPYAIRTICSRRPRLPVHGAKLVYEYISWIIDHACEWQPMDTPFEQYVKHLIRPEVLEAAEIREVDWTGVPSVRPRAGTISDATVPHVERGNKLIDALTDRLQFYSAHLRLTLDAFMGISTWETYQVTNRGINTIVIEKLGDYRILEWERLKKEGKI